ncbi:MAG: hypothetical protein OXF84_06575, partial [Bacteroidetes bacterium]|nr:hypothetical protein [Bacteroidota bacterium]
KNLTEIDEHVYTAMSSLAGEQLDTIGDLSRSLSDWESAEIGQSLPPEAVSKLMGHLAEPRVAENLENMGIQVEMPNLSNQEGYDLILNGEYFVNVKTVADASSLSSHFENYPNIPVIVPSDMNGIPEDAISFGVDDSVDKVITALDLKKENLVLVDDNLVHAEMLEHAENLSDSLLGSVEGSFPLITLAFSGFREFRLLSQQKTQLIISAKNVGLDLLGIGGGGSLFGSLGAILGTLLMPGLGTVLGTLIFSAGGAFGGRFITDKIKNLPLKKTLKQYDEKLEQSESEIHSLQGRAQNEIQRERQILNGDLAESTRLLKSELEDEYASLIQDRRNILHVEMSEAQKLLATALTSVQQDLERLQLIPAWKRMLLGGKLRSDLQLRVGEIKQLSQQLKSYDDKIKSTHLDLIGDDAIHFLQLILCTGTNDSEIIKMIQSADSKRKEVEMNWQARIVEKQQKLIEHRFKAMEKLVEKIQIQQKAMDQEIGNIREELEPLYQDCMKQMDRLGKKSSQKKE